jgi:hypothetical protein
MAGPVDCLYTTVQNTTGHEATFSFIPPHGRRMAAGEQLTIAGNLGDRLAKLTSNRNFKALERALSSGALTIVSTPTVFVSDDTGDATHGVGMGAGGALGTVDPCWVGP